MRDNNSPEIRFYLRLLRALMRDYSDLWSSTEQCDRDFMTIESRVACEGIRFLTVAFPALGKALDRALSGDTNLEIPPGFTARNGTALPSLLGDLFASIFDDNGEHLPVVRPVPCEGDRLVRSIAGIRQLTYVFYKLELPFRNEQINSSVQGYVETDLGLPDRGSFSFAHDPVLRMARSLISSVLSRLDSRDITPRHGNGSVATSEVGPMKSRFKRLYSTMEPVYPFMEYMMWSPSHVVDVYGELQDRIEVIPYPTAKMAAVPKDSRGPRLISMEPLETQWIQQGLMRKLYQLVERHPLTAGQICFTDQTVNQEMAHAGSITGHWVTLDMKDASDRVSLALFDELFSAVEFHSAALASRSVAVKLLDGRVHQLRKFASMGSALCFPVEALTFWALSVSTLQACTSWSLRFAAKHVYVFGDDIVVPSRYHKAIIDSLERYGLLFNREKCCVGEKIRFRESCGLDVCEGFNVSPLRIKRRPNGAFVDWVPSYVSQSNAMYARGLRHAASELEQAVLNARLPVPYVTEDCEVLGFKRPYACARINTHIRRRFHRSRDKSQPQFLRHEYRVLAIVNKKSRPLYDGWEELLRCESEKASGPSARPALSRWYSNRGEHRLETRWSPLSV